MRKSVLVLGTCTVDISIAPISGGNLTSTTGRISICPGGSCRNVAENLARLGTNVTLVSMIGADNWGSWLQAECEKAGVTTRFVVESSARTPIYVAMLENDGRVVFDCIDDGGTFEKFESGFKDFLNSAEIALPDMVVTSTDIGDALFETLSAWTRQRGIELAVGASSAYTSPRVFRWLKGVDHLFLNRGELKAILGYKQDDSTVIAQGVKSLCEAGPKTLVCTNGAEATYFCSRDSAEVQQLRPYDPKSPVLSSVGCGDALESGVIWGFLGGLFIEEAVKVGLALACITLQSRRSSSSELNLATVSTYLDRELRHLANM